MSNTRGFGGKKPCPVCLVPQDELSNLTGNWELCTWESMKGVFEEASGMTRKMDAEDLLKSYGLRKVEVRVFCSKLNADCK